MELKIRVKSRLHSKAIQERLFQLGYRWVGESIGTFWGLEKPFIFVGRDKIISCGEDGHQKYFNEHGYKEVTLDDLYDMDVVKEYTMKELVEIVGHEFKIIK